jgi:hypothetical protein
MKNSPRWARPRFAKAKLKIIIKINPRKNIKNPLPKIEKFQNNESGPVPEIRDVFMFPKGKLRQVCLPIHPC